LATNMVASAIPLPAIFQAPWPLRNTSEKQRDFAGPLEQKVQEDQDWNWDAQEPQQSVLHLILHAQWI
jgi:hypothetical protein